jgi:NAD+ kinase
VSPESRLHRVGLVVHPERELDGALDTVRGWAAAHDAEVVQVPIDRQDRVVGEAGDAASCDLVVALGGDGTTLAALHAAAPYEVPVLGVACGSLGALTAVASSDLDEALRDVAAGNWRPRRLPGVAVAADDHDPYIALNDLVVVRNGASQVAIAIYLDEVLYVRFAGDGVVVATPLGSSAYTLAAGGPIVAPAADNIIVTPLAPHGGCCPPLVAGSDSRIRIEVEARHGGARIECDGQIRPVESDTLQVSWRDGHATLVEFGDAEELLTGLRRRRIIIDSPRVLARDDREARATPGE